MTKDTIARTTLLHSVSSTILSENAWLLQSLTYTIISKHNNYLGYSPCRVYGNVSSEPRVSLVTRFLPQGSSFCAGDGISQTNSQCSYGRPSRETFHVVIKAKLKSKDNHLMPSRSARAWYILVHWTTMWNDQQISWKVINTVNIRCNCSILTSQN